MKNLAAIVLGFFFLATPTLAQSQPPAGFATPASSPYALSTALQFRTLEDLKAAFPNAEFREVKPGELRNIQREYEALGYQAIPLPPMKAQTKVQDEDEQKKEEEKERRKKKEEEDKEKEYRPENREFSGRGGFYLNFYGGGGGNGDGKGAIILLLVIAFIVIAVLLVAMVKAGHELIANPARVDSVIGFDLIYTGFSYEAPAEDDPSADLVVENGQLTGLRFSLSMVGSAGHEIGLISEFGAIQGTFPIQGSAVNLELQGSYATIGVMAGVYNSARTFRLTGEIMDGISDREEIRRVSIARIGVTAHPSGDEGFYLGMYLGTLYLKLQEELGFVRSVGDFNLIWSFNLGYRF